ncbi:MAG TPA: tetratricopeptide repeat protein [Ohtaekwangia sp.]|uniref:tetratricopeptide repeat protein n=1 Tax=Ohtaekwangia sp. TaxID=2066019 RepID=UPI002F95A434
MKYIVVSLFLIAFVTDPLRIGKINRAKSEARDAYTSGDYKAAIQKYHYLIDSMKVAEDELKLNLANAYFLLNDTANAITNYQSLTASKKNEVRSKAHQQLGIINYRKQKLEEALNDFKQAIKAHPDNMDARYNYELLKKKLDEKNKKDQQQRQNKDQKQDQKKDQQNKDQQNKDQKDQQKKDQEKKDQQNKEQQKKDQQQKEQEQKEKEQQQKEKEQQQKDQQKKDQEKKDQQDKKDQQSEQKDEQQKQEKKPNPQLSEKLEQMKMSEEKARMILEAMKNQEVQYLQQNKRKATKPRDKGKPDW